jgi:cold shock CspA family protein
MDVCKTPAEGQAVEFAVQAGDTGLHATTVTRA